MIILRKFSFANESCWCAKTWLVLVQIFATLVPSTKSSLHSQTTNASNSKGIGGVVLKLSNIHPVVFKLQIKVNFRRKLFVVVYMGMLSKRGILDSATMLVFLAIAIWNVARWVGTSSKQGKTRRAWLFCKLLAIKILQKNFVHTQNRFTAPKLTCSCCQLYGKSLQNHPRYSQKTQRVAYN